MMSLWDALRMNMMISYQELVRTFLRRKQQKISIVLIFSFKSITFTGSGRQIRRGTSH